MNTLDPVCRAYPVSPEELRASNSQRVRCERCWLPVLDLERHVSLVHGDDTTFQLHPHLAMLARPKPSEVEPEPVAHTLDTRRVIYIDNIKLSVLVQDRLLLLLRSGSEEIERGSGAHALNNAMIVRELVRHDHGRQHLTERGRRFAGLLQAMFA